MSEFFTAADKDHRWHIAEIRDNEYHVVLQRPKPARTILKKGLRVAAPDPVLEILCARLNRGSLGEI